MICLDDYPPPQSFVMYLLKYIELNWSFCQEKQRGGGQNGEIVRMESEWNGNHLFFLFFFLDLVLDGSQGSRGLASTDQPLTPL